MIARGTVRSFIWRQGGWSVPGRMKYEGGRMKKAKAVLVPPSSFPGRMKDEGGRMKKAKAVLVPPSSFLLHPSSFIPPSSFLLVVIRGPKSSMPAGAPENIFDSCLRERNLARIIDRFPIA